MFQQIWLWIWAKKIIWLNFSENDCDHLNLSRLRIWKRCGALERGSIAMASFTCCMEWNFIAVRSMILRCKSWHRNHCYTCCLLVAYTCSLAKRPALHELSNRKPYQWLNIILMAIDSWHGSRIWSSIWLLAVFPANISHTVNFVFFLCRRSSTFQTCKIQFHLWSMNYWFFHTISHHRYPWKYWLDMYTGSWNIGQ